MSSPWDARTPEINLLIRRRVYEAARLIEDAWSGLGSADQAGDVDKVGFVTKKITDAHRKPDGGFPKADSPLTAEFVLVPAHLAFYRRHLYQLDRKLNDSKVTFKIRYLNSVPIGSRIFAEDGGAGTIAFTPESLMGSLGDVTLLKRWVSDPSSQARWIVHEWGRKYADLPQQNTNDRSIKDVNRWDAMVDMFANGYRDIFK